MKNKESLRSARWFAPDDLRSFGHRSRAMQMGYGPEDWAGKPVIAIINTLVSSSSQLFAYHHIIIIASPYHHHIIITKMTKHKIKKKCYNFPPIVTLYFLFWTSGIVKYL